MVDDGAKEEENEASMTCRRKNNDLEDSDDDGDKFVGAMAMLLQNFIVEHKIMNGYVRMLKAIIYESPNGPADKNVLAKYVIVDFKQSTLSDDEPTIEGAPSTWIAVPVATKRCEKNC